MVSIKSEVKITPIDLVRVHLFALVLCLLIPVRGSGQEKAPTVADSRRAVLILGDSLAAGYGLEPSQAFPALRHEKADEDDLKRLIINAGLSGDTSAGGLRRIDWLLKREIDILVLELGGNDGLRGIQPEATKTNLQGIID